MQIPHICSKIRDLGDLGSPKSVKIEQKYGQKHEIAVFSTYEVTEAQNFTKWFNLEI